jgi:hypothetical protein
MSQNNVIQWIFEKAFDQLTLDGKELYATPFEKIYAKTFGCKSLYQTINQLSSQDIKSIEEYLVNHQFQKQHLFGKLKKKINVAVLLNDNQWLNELINSGYQPNSHTLQLVILNGRVDALKLLLSNFPKLKLTNELLIYCVEFNHEETYFYLREHNLVPNVSIYSKAVFGNSLNIIKDIGSQIGLSAKILSDAIQTNQTDIVLYLINEAIEDKIKISSNLMTYPIMNNNFDLLHRFEEIIGSNAWHNELYYSALLSGSMKMIEYAESKLYQIHHDLILDMNISKTKKGQKTLLLDNIIYQRNGKKYFSHTMNYAIQSNELDIVKYVHSKGYGITQSNVITAIKQASPEILKFILNVYNKPLDRYIIYYLGINSFISDKFEKTKILIESNLINFNQIKSTIDDYRTESVHLDMINQQMQFCEEGNYDLDYLMKYQLFFVPIKGFKLNHWVLTVTKICIQHNLDNILTNICKNLNPADKQLCLDCIYLFGSLNQIRQYHAIIDINLVPSTQVIMESICYCQIGKLSYLFHKGLLTESLLNTLNGVIVALDNSLLNTLFDRIKDGNYKSDIRHLILSKNKASIAKWFDENTDDLPKDVIKELLRMEDINLIKKLNFSHIKIPELIDWTEDEDLLEIRNYLQTISK